MPEFDATVEYREAAGHSGYLVGGDGTVWCQRPRGPRRKAPAEPREVTPRNNRGYRTVLLDGRNRSVHHLVLEAFVGERPAGTEACHGDGDRGNNRRENLRWGTRLENMHDMVRHGRSTKGTRCRRAKLTEDRVLEILHLHSAGRSCRSLGRQFGVSHVTVLEIVAGEKWAHVWRAWREQVASA